MTITFNREIALKSWGCEQELLEHFHNILAQSEPNVLALLTIVVTKGDRTENVRQSLAAVLLLATKVHLENISLKKTSHNLDDLR